MNTRISAIILTTGIGKRMNSKKPGVLHKVCGKPMMNLVLDSVREAGISNIFILARDNVDLLKSHIEDPFCTIIDESDFSPGNGNLPHVFNNGEGPVLIIPANMPFIKGDTIKAVIENHITEKWDYTLCNSQSMDSASDFPIVCSYGIFEAISSNPECFNSLVDGDCPHDKISVLQNKCGGCFYVADSVELFSVKDLMQLAMANNIMRQKILDRHMMAGVSIIDTMTTYIDTDVEIGQDTVIYPGTILESGTEVGQDCIIGPNTRLSGCVVGDRTEIAYSVAFDSRIGNGTKIGPFAYIRPESEIGDNVKIGDFVEIKKSAIGDGSKVPHLTYVGDAYVGKNVNLGCGVVFVNYNGKEKNKTTVKDNAFIGCNVNLIAPVTVNENAYIAAGSTVTEEVPADSLAIARSRQVNKVDWVSKKGLKKKS